MIVDEVSSVFLDEASKRHADKFILMFTDQAGWHKSKELDIPKNIRLVSLPAYSPELNPTEHVWDELREKHFYNIAFDSLNAVEDVLEIGLRELVDNKPLIKSSACFSWLLNIV